MEFLKQVHFYKLVLYKHDLTFYKLLYCYPCVLAEFSVLNITYEGIILMNKS